MQSSSLPSEQDSIWDYYQNEGVEAFSGSTPRLRFLVEHLRRATAPRAPGEVRVLNIGVGAGTFEELAAQAGFRVHCLDPSERAVAEVGRRLELGDRARVGCSNQLPFEDRSLDAVVVSEVLEHLDSQTLDDTLHEIRRVLAPNGLLLGTVPAREVLAQNVAVCPSCATRFHRWGHVQSFTRERLDTVLTGFERVALDQRTFPDWSGLNWRGKLAAFAKKLGHRFGVHGSGETFVFEARSAGR